MAGASVSFKIDSNAVRELAAKIASIDRKVARAALKKGINEVSKVVLAEAKALVPVRTGQLRRSLGRKVKSVRGGAVVYAVIKPRAGVWMKATEANVAAGRSTGQLRLSKDGKRVFVRKFRKDFGPGVGIVNPVKYAHLVEFGRRSVSPKKKKVLAGHGKVYGRHARAVPPRPFMRPAWENNKDRAVEIILRCLNDGLRNFLANRRTKSGRR